MPASRGVALAAAADALCVVVFVAVGRRSHDEDGSVVGGVAAVAAPFLIGLVVAWVATAMWRAPQSVERAMIMWPVMVTVGLLLRRFAFDRGIAVPFIIVAAVVTGVLLIGWRAVTGRRRASERPSS